MSENRIYHLGLYEKALPPSLSYMEKLRMCGQCGFDHMELSIDETSEKISRLYEKGTATTLRRAITETGIPISTLCLSAHRKFPLGSHSSTIRLHSLDLLKRAAELAAESGIWLIQLAGYDVYYEEHDEQTEMFFCENLQQAVAFADQYGISMGFETMETPFMDTVEKAVKYVRLANSSRLGLYPDIGNLQNAAVLYGWLTAEDLRAGEGHIYAAHLKETKPGIYRNLLPGTGHTDYSGCLRELWRQGVRTFTGELWYQGKSDAAVLLQQASAFLRNKIESVSITMERP